MNITNRVLIVDDDPPTCELIRDMLTAAGIEACSLTNTTAAALRLRREKFDAVFLDARMPSPDGLELTQQLRSAGLNKKSVVVMISGNHEREFMTRAFDVGVNFVLFKPVDRQAISRLLRVTQGPIDREKRRFTRVRIQRKISMKYGQEHAQGTTVDLSVSGMLVKSPRRFPMGAVVHIILELDKAKPPLYGSARVMRMDGEDGMGLEFENPTAVDTERLNEFLLPHILQLQETAKAS